MAVDALTDFDTKMGSAGFFADPYPLYHQLRADQPIFWSERWGCWLLTRYHDVHACLRAGAAFSNVGRQAAMLRRLPTERQAGLRALTSHYSSGLSNQDPPAHTRLRGLVSRAFTPRVVANLSQRIQQIVDELLDRLELDTPIDVIREYAYPLPAIVIAELLGLPAEDREQFKAWSTEITAFLGTGHDDAQSAERGQLNMLELRAYLARMIEVRRAAPRADLLSGLVRAEEQGDVLGDNEILGSCVTLLLGGHETTTNLIGNGLLALLRTPDQLARLRRDPDLMPTAVEELLRFDAPVQRVWRLLAAAVDLGGRRLERGEAVFLMAGSANRDSAQFADPDTLDLSRKPNRHLTFGHGIHFCLGAPLARLEASIAFTSLLRRFPQIELATKRVDYHPNIAFRGLKSLPVVVSAAGRGGLPM
jgi:cytochrome P450